MQTQLEHDVWQWMDEVLSVPRPEFNNFPICPFIKTYRDSILVKEITWGVAKPIRQACELLLPLNLKALCLAFPRSTKVSRLTNVCDRILNETRFKHLDILINDPNLKGPIRGVYTGFDRAPLVIIQEHDLLKLSRKKAKSQGYYEKN